MMLKNVFDVCERKKVWTEGTFICWQESSAVFQPDHAEFCKRQFDFKPIRTILKGNWISTWLVVASVQLARSQTGNGDGGQSKWCKGCRDW